MSLDHELTHRLQAAAARKGISVDTFVRAAVHRRCTEVLGPGTNDQSETVAGIIAAVASGYLRSG